ncbi:MAG: homocysteine S-methyltransferase family protein [Pseudomonadota bacterium]
MTEFTLPDAPRFFLTDGGIETYLIFDEGLDLPDFAAFTLLKSQEGVAALSNYYRRYLKTAMAHQMGFVFETPTWRASSDWGDRLGYSAQDLAKANANAIALMIELNQEFGSASIPVLISGCVGPRGDGYDPGDVMTAGEAAAYHQAQVSALAGAGADLITGITMTNTPEAIGLVRAAAEAVCPAVISFTVETDGRLPTGQPLADAILETDRATDHPPAWYMINCAHPTHFRDVLDPDAAWVRRIGGLRANASCKSHAELDEATELDRGDIPDLARRYGDLCALLPALRVLGGCCGTDHHHIGAIAREVGCGCGS